MTITDFLLARIAADEAAADRVEFRPYVGEGEPSSLTSRVLAECEAKRRIVEDATNQHTSCVELDWVVRVLASVYADHPDFDDAWRAD